MKNIESKQAIITGSTGFIGSALARLLLKNDYEVIALGRSEFNVINPLRLSPHKHLRYIKIDMKDICDLPDLLHKNDITISKNCIFYHFAWGDKSGLSSLDIQGQYENVIYTINSFKIADTIGVKRYVYIGSMEEWFAKGYLCLNYYKDSYFNRHVIYALAKKCARDFLKAIAREHKIELIIATNSHILGVNDTRDSFLKIVVEKIINNENIEMTSGEQNFDCVNVSDCVRAYKLIGEIGSKNKEYWIGSNHARKLKEYVLSAIRTLDSNIKVEFGKVAYNDISLPLLQFSPLLLYYDTGFVCEKSYESGIKELYDFLKYGIFKDT